MNKKGFTLIEIVVVIAIVVIVSTISVISYVNIQKKVEEKRLKEAVTILGAAAEVYLHSNEEYLDKVLNGCCDVNIPIGLLVEENLVKTQTFEKIKKTDGTLISLADNVKAKENCGGEIAYEIDGVYAENDVTYECSNKTAKLEQDIADLKSQISSGLGSGGEANTCQNNKGITNRVYLSGETISYSGLNWKVLEDKGNNITLILDGNYKVGKYGTSLDWKSSTAYQELNTNFVGANSTIQTSIDNKCIKKNASSDSYIRLPNYNELGPVIKNSSNTPFWTMSAGSNQNLILGSAEGSLEKTGTYSLKDYTVLYRGLTRRDNDTSPGYANAIASITIGTYYLSYQETTEVMQAKYDATKFVKSNLVSTELGYASSTRDSAERLTYRWCETTGITSQYYDGNRLFVYAAEATCLPRTSYSLAAATSIDIGYRPVLTIFKNS